MFIKDALGHIVLKLSTLTKGKLLDIQMMDVSNFKLDKKYQRNISPAALKKGGPLDLTKLTPIVVCKRPDHFGDDGGYFVVDGQHRTMRVLHSDYEGQVPVQVYHHAANASLEDCVKFESNLFFELNSLGKKPSKMDEIRAGIYSGNEESLHILDCMELLNVTSDNFGSDKDDAREIEVFYHFYLLTTSDYARNQKAKLADGMKLLNEMYPNEKTVNSYMLRATCLLAEFEKELGNGRGKAFGHYIRNVLPQTKQVKHIVKGRGVAQAPMYILHDIISDYKLSPAASNPNLSIGPETLARLSNKDLGGNPRFRNPDTENPNYVRKDK